VGISVQRFEYQVVRSTSQKNGIQGTEKDRKAPGETIMRPTRSFRSARKVGFWKTSPFTGRSSTERYQRRMSAVPRGGTMPCIMDQPRQSTPLSQLHKACKMHIISPQTRAIAHRASSRESPRGLVDHFGWLCKPAWGDRQCFAAGVMEAGSDKETGVSLAVPSLVSPSSLF